MRDPLAAEVDQDPDQLACNIAEEFWRPQASSRVVLCLAAFGLAILGCLVVARFGTDLARVLVAVCLLTSFASVIVFVSWVRRKRKDVPFGLQQALKRLPSEFAGQVERAYRLFSNLQSQPSGAGSSLELAQLHASRLLKRVDLEQIFEIAKRAKTTTLRYALFLCATCTLFLFCWSLELLEGLDVLIARGGVGPFPIAYVDDIEITAEWPSYLDGTGERRRLHSELTGVPQGTEIEVRVVPLVQGRKLLLTDGNEQVALVSDGQGGLVGRWVADDPAALKVAARFGGVLLYDHHQTRVEPLDDRAPSVVLVQAPQTIALSALDRLDLTFVAADDHGLHQVDLVLQSGQRSTRTELARLDGQTRVFRGGHAVSREQELLRKPFLPVHIWIEARDGNTATGPSWGRSKELLILPEPLGQALKERHVALRSFRRSLSAYVAQMHRAGYQEPLTRGEQEKLASDELVAALSELQRKWETDATAPARSLAFLSAQVETLNREGKKRASAEDVLLAVDALIHSLSHVDATQLAKDLGQAVEEIAVQSRQLHFDPASLRVDGLLDLLSSNQAAANQLSEVGELGLDLGSVALADLTRISRNIKDRTFDRAEASALHLAERLKRATPSFSSTSGGAGVESGAPSHGQGSGKSSAEGQSTSDAPSEFERLAEELDQLAQEGAEELGELERLLKEAEEAVRKDVQGSSELDAALDELQKALTDLPEVGRGIDNASSDAASARSQGEAAIEALEGLELKEGIERGRDAERSLARARSRLLDGFGFVSEASLKRAEQALKTVMDEAKQAFDRAQTSSKQMDEQRRRERTERQRDLAARASDLAKRGHQPQSALPKANIEDLNQASRLLKQAAQALDEGNAERGLELAEQAQHHMEQAAFERKEQESSDATSSGEGSEMDRKGQIPGSDRDRAKEFRERVEQGLGRGSGRLSPAVRRYAEDLK